MANDGHPVTLADFQAPLDLFGEKGLLSTTVPDRIGIGVVRETVHVVVTTRNRVDWYWTKTPIAAGSRWERAYLEAEGTTVLEDLV